MKELRAAPEHRFSRQGQWENQPDADADSNCSLQSPRQVSRHVGLLLAASGKGPGRKTGLSTSRLVHMGNQVDATADSNESRDSPQQHNGHCSLLSSCFLPIYQLFPIPAVPPWNPEGAALSRSTTRNEDCSHGRELDRAQPSGMWDWPSLKSIGSRTSRRRPLTPPRLQQSLPPLHGLPGVGSPLLPRLDVPPLLAAGSSTPPTLCPVGR